MSFIRLDNEDITITAETTVSPAWGTSTETLTSFFTSSFQSGSESGPYHLSVYSEDQGTSAPSGSILFSIAHAVSGSELAPQKAVWDQYTTLLYGSDKEKAKQELSENFAVINLNRTVYKERVEVSSFSIDIEDSTTTYILSVSDPNSFETIDTGRKFKLKDTGLQTITNPGYLFPDMGIIVVTLDTPPTNLSEFFTWITQGGNFTLRSEETITSNFVFIRARNSQLNYSTNPSFVSSNGVIRDPKLIDSPQVFPTSIGLYNDANELVAVAKLSRPLIKDFNKEALLRVKLDY